MLALEDFGLELAMQPKQASSARLSSPGAGRSRPDLRRDDQPYPPGIPAMLPGEQITEPVVTYLTTGAAAGFLIPDAPGPQMQTIRVVAE
jgi:hypothetical protein